MDWPAQSPDLNPIEHLWYQLKRKLNAYPTHPSNIRELKARIETEWYKITKTGFSTTQFSPYSLTNQPHPLPPPQLNITTTTNTSTHDTLIQPTSPPESPFLSQDFNPTTLLIRDPYLTFSLPRKQTTSLRMSPLDKQKTIKKASETVASSPIAGRTRTSTAAPTLQEIMDGLQSMLTPQLANLKSDVVSSVSASLNVRFMDLENNLDQFKTTMDNRQQAMQAELSQVLQRLEAVEQENATLRGAPASPTNQNVSTTPSNPTVLGTAASKCAILSSQTSTPAESSQRSAKPAPSGDAYYGGLRFFTPVSSNQGFQHLYLPSRGRRSCSEIRDLLDQKVQMDRGAVIDMHYSSSTVIALLVHNDYVETATRLLRAKKLTPIEGFNPYDHKNLGNKEYACCIQRVR